MSFRLISTFMKTSLGNVIKLAFFLIT